MKKIFNRVLAAAIAVPMVLTQGVMNISAEDTGAKELTMDSFTRIAVDKTESQWNEALYNVVLSMEGTQKEITAADVLNLVPQTNVYGVMLKEVLAGAPNPVLAVNGGVITVSGTADLSAYAAEKIYSKVNAAAGTELTMTAFNKTIEYSVTVDGNALASGKTVDVDPVIVIDGTEIDETNASAYVQGLADDLAAEIASQVGINAEIEEAMTVELINKIKRAEYYAGKAETLSRTGSYATADEMMAAIAKFVDNRTEVYNFPATVDEAVARHGNGFNAAVELLSDITVSSGYVLSITADDVAALAKSGSAFEVSAAGGTYNVTFNIPDAEAAEVEEYVNANAVPDADGITWVYESSNKTVEAEINTDGVVYFNVTRNIKLQDSQLTTTTTTTTTTDTGTTTTTTDTTTTTTTTTTTGTGDSTTTTTTTSETTIPSDFVLESIEVEAGKDYYFSHDENAFDLATLIESLTLVGNINGEATSFPIAAQDYANYLTPAYATPADFFNAVEGAAYVANKLNVTFTAPAEMLVAEGANLTVANLPTVYIGVKGDADLNGAVGLDDVSKVLTYYAYNGASLTPSLNEDAELEVLAYFLADVDTEAKTGADTDTNKLTLDDGSYIITYYAQKGASLDPEWDVILGR